MILNEKTSSVKRTLNTTLIKIYNPVIVGKTLETSSIPIAFINAIWPVITTAPATNNIIRLFLGILENSLNCPNKAETTTANTDPVVNLTAVTVMESTLRTTFLIKTVERPKNRAEDKARVSPIMKDDYGYSYDYINESIQLLIPQPH